ncbi:MAG: ATP-binding protein [Gammaproteobacteria bacterium]|nr:ATP-binding protein [Gammaproteobacteria bacterium]
MSDGELREAFATLLSERPFPQPRSAGPEYLNELHLYQLELEMQNRELHASQVVLEESRERYAELYDNAPVGYVTLDSKGIIQDINLTAVSLLEHARCHLIGLPFASCLTKDQSTVLFKFLNRIEKSGESLALETWISAPKNTRREVQLVGSARKDVINDKIQYRLAIYDITKRKDADRDTEARKEALVHMARINTVGELAASLAHELTQPLQAVEHFNHAAIQLVQRQGMDEKEETEVLKLLQASEQQLQRAGKIIFHLRKFIRHGTVNRHPENLRDVIAASLELMQPMLRDKAVEVSLTGRTDLPLVNIEPVQIEQVLVNLLRNSIEAMSRIGSESRRIDIKLITSGDYVQVTIHDNGPGLNALALDHIFDVWESDKADGMGMGLAISRSLIKAHGGRLWVDTQEKSGAAFNFTLPFAATEIKNNGL